MRRPLRNVGTAVIVLITLLLANVTYIQVIRSESYRNDPNNRRTLVAEYSRQRGQITAVGGVVLARSDPVDDPYRYQRVYPNGELYADLTGYYSMRYGPTGLERSQNEVLSGEAPDLIAGQLSDLITGRDPRGGNVELTVVPAVQEAAFNAMRDKGYVGAVVALRPSTGEILAMVSTPSYDPTPLASHSDTVQRAAYNALIPSPDSGEASPLLNRATQAVYPPGSTFKVVVAAAALQQDFTADTPVTGAATITLPDTGGATLSNFQGNDCAGGGGRDVPLRDALAYSCNTAFAEVAMELGADPLREQAVALGWNPDGMDVGLEVVPSRLGVIPDAAALAQTGIGQRDVVATPMEMAMVASTIANQGERMQPYLIGKTTKPDLSVIAQTDPQSLGQAMPPPVAATVRDMMVASEQRTPGSGGIANLVIASKTGTAEHGVDPKNTPPHGWYIAFAPADNPQVAVAVLVENGGSGGLEATGSQTAGPVGRAVLAAALAGGP